MRKRQLESELEVLKIRVRELEQQKEYTALCAIAPNRKAVISRLEEALTALKSQGVSAAERDPAEYIITCRTHLQTLCDLAEAGLKVHWPQPHSLSLPYDWAGTPTSPSLYQTLGNSLGGLR